MNNQEYNGDSGHSVLDFPLGSSDFIERQTCLANKTNRDGSDTTYTIIRSDSLYSDTNPFEFPHRNLIQEMQQVSRAVGGCVEILPELGYCPFLRGSDSHPVLLYEVIEAIDGIIDYDELKEEFPNLSYTQLNGAISFLRKLAQFNTRNIDVDALEDEADLSNTELVDAIVQAVELEEQVRVPNSD